MHFNVRVSDIYITGYFGESVSSDSGLISIIKAHGHCVQIRSEKFWSSSYTTEEIRKTNGRAVVLVRNPFTAIYGYRHVTTAGHTGHTTSSQFIGPGQFKSVERTVISIYRTAQ